MEITFIIRSQSPGAGVAEPDLLEELEQQLDHPWCVILHDDNLHTYEYVIEMLMKIFGMDVNTAFHHALEVDTRGTTVLARLPQTDAERKRDQIMRHGGDIRMSTTISMIAHAEPCED